MSDVRGNRLQSRVLLPFARVVMLWAAAAAFFVTLGGLAVGVLLYAQSSYTPLLPEPPLPDVDSGGAWDPSGFAPQIEYEIANVDRDRLSAGSVVALVYSANDLDPIVKATLLPGPAADRFNIVAPAGQEAMSRFARELPLRKFKVTAGQKLIDDLAADADAKSYRMSLELTFENGRQPQKSRFDFVLVFPRKAGDEAFVPQTSTPQVPLPVPDARTPTSESARAAQALALIIDPMRTPAYFSAYERALRQIQSCGPDSEAFAGNLNRQIEAHKAKLSRHNALRFAARVCDLWRTAVSNYAEQRAKREAALAQAAAESLSRRATSMIALYVAGSALATFLMLALALALLAIENHVRVIREGGNAPR